MASKRRTPYTEAELQREKKDCSDNTSYAFSVAQDECYGQVVVMLTGYRNLEGGLTAFAKFNKGYTDQQALRYLEEAVKKLKAKIA